MREEWPPNSQKELDERLRSITATTDSFWRKLKGVIALSVAAWLLLLFGGSGLPNAQGEDTVFLMSPGFIIVAVLVLYLLAGLRVMNQYERGVILTLGKYTGTRQPGLRWILLGIQRLIRVDLRIRVVDVPDQDCMTKDNVSVNVNAVLYYLISSAERAVLEVENFANAVSQLAQTTMRDVVGEVTLDDLLSNRDQVSKRIQEIVDKASDPWGIKVQSVDLKHIELPKDMKRTMGKEAEAERERRAVIIKSKGELSASDNLARAAAKLAKSPGALHLRTLHSINDLSSDQSNTVVFAVPLEILRAIERVGGGTKTSSSSDRP